MAVERGVVLLDVLIYCVFALGAAVWERDFGGVELPGGLERPEGEGGRGWIHLEFCIMFRRCAFFSRSGSEPRGKNKIINPYWDIQGDIQSLRCRRFVLCSCCTIQV